MKFRQRLTAQPGSSTFSKHLKILGEAGLVDCRKCGLWVTYSLADGQSTPYAATMLGNLSHWLENDPQLVGKVK